MASLEEASHCPKCSQQGELTLQSAGPRVGSKALTYTCKNNLCLWFNTGWVVQVNPDGTIPERKAGPKQFEKLTPGQETFARDVLHQVEYDQQRSTEKDAEVKKGNI